jgi:nitrogen regulatory protein P-II 1
MKKIEAIISPIRLDAVKSALQEIGVAGLTVLDAAGMGTHKGIAAVYRGVEVPNRLLPRVKIEAVVGDDQAEAVVTALIDAASTGEPGDGKIFISEVLDAVRIRTGQRGVDALT